MNKVFKIILVSILSVLLFLIFLASNSADYLLNYWGEMSFSTVIYQLNTPLKGTSSEVLMQYVQKALCPAVLEFLFCILIYVFCKIILEKVLICLKGHIFKYSFNIVFRISQKKKKMIKGLVITVCTACCVIVLGHKCSLVGIPEYIDEITHPSTIFEDEYIDPNTVNINFRERKNLLYIYIESMETTYADVESGGGKEKNYITNLKKLAEDNLFFSHTEAFGGLYQNSGANFTMGALLASTTGVPYKLSINAKTVGDYQDFLPGITALGNILEKEGYCNYFACGSDISFGGRELFFKTHGNYNFYDYYAAIEDGVVNENYYEFWGIEDCKLYDYAKEKLTEIAQKDELFNFTLLTVDTHFPDGYICELCEETHTEQYANAIVCADKQIMNFLDWVKKQPWYEDTVVVITGDHTSMNRSFFEDLPDGYPRRIYNCFLNTDLEPKKGTKNREANILDMFPTTLAAIGAEIEGERLGLGTNLFSDRPTLSEEMGRKEFFAATAKYSNYYNEHFIKESKED